MMRLCVFMAICLGCESAPPYVPPEDRAQARQITDTKDLIGGPKASGRAGDFLLANTRVKAVIAAAMSVLNNSASCSCTWMCPSASWLSVTSSSC